MNRKLEIPTWLIGMLLIMSATSIYFLARILTREIKTLMASSGNVVPIGRMARAARTLGGST
jgi:hypothetical protein